MDKQREDGRPYKYDNIPSKPKVILQLPSSQPGTLALKIESQQKKSISTKGYLLQ
jgi:hypothetical protein